MSKRTSRVEILNPQGTIRIISPSAAFEMIRKGEATYVNERAIMRVATCAKTGAKVARDWRSGYDRTVATKMSRPDELKHVPVIAPEKLYRNTTIRTTPRKLLNACGAIGSGRDMCKGPAPKRRKY